MDLSLPQRFAPSGLVVAAVGFALTRFTVTLARYEDPFQFVVGGAVPLVLGLGLAAFGVALVVGEFDRVFVRRVTAWCLAGAAAMLVLVVLTLAANGTSFAMEPIRSRTYLSNFLIGGSVGGALTGVYAARSAGQRRDLARQASQLEMVNRLLRDEVLNAVTVIRGRAEVLRSVTDEGEPTGGLRASSDRGSDDDSVAAIKRRSDDVESTIRNVKHITRNGDDGATLDATPVADCVSAAVGTVRDRYPDARLTTDGVDGDLLVWANPLLEDAVTHLVENAVAYSDAPTPRAEVAVTTTESTVSIAVTDNGPGLPADQRSLIERGEIGDYRDRSTGFGLNIVRLLAHSYDGSVDATVTDSGTTVTLTLRRADTPDRTAPSTRSLSPSRLGVALVSSLVAGLVMGVSLQLAVGTVPVIGALYGAGNVWVGWITHEFHSVVFGLAYAALVALVPDRYGDGVTYYGVALAWATILWLVAASLVMPAWLRLVGVPAALPNLRPTLLAGHLLWGGTLAVCYRAGCSFATRWTEP